MMYTHIETSHGTQKKGTKLMFCASDKNSFLKKLTFKMF
jgi:hypothetical protein